MPNKPCLPHLCELREDLHLDYKTSKKPVITSSYKLQLAVYALLYTEKTGKSPHMVGIHFLNHGEELIDVTDKLIAFAGEECITIQDKTKFNDIAEYPKSPGPLCKYNTGKCDFYDICKPFEDD